MSCEENRAKFFGAVSTGTPVAGQLGGDAPTAAVTLDAIFQRGRTQWEAQGKPGPTSPLRMQAELKTRQLFDQMREKHGLSPPTHSPTGLPKADAQFGYAAVYDTLQAVRARQTLPPVAQEVMDGQQRRRLSAVGQDAQGYTRCGECGRFVSAANPADHVCPKTATAATMARALGRRLGVPPTAYQVPHAGTDGLDAVLAEARDPAGPGLVRMVHNLTGEEVEATLDGVLVALQQGFVPTAWRNVPTLQQVALPNGRIVPVLDATGLHVVTPAGAITGAAGAYGAALPAGTSVRRGSGAIPALAVLTGPGTTSVQGQPTGRYDLGRFIGTEFRKGHGQPIAAGGQTYTVGDTSTDPADWSSARHSGAAPPPGRGRIAVGRTLPAAVDLLAQGHVVETPSGQIQLYDDQGHELLAVYDPRTATAGDTAGTPNASPAQFAAILAHVQRHPAPGRADHAALAANAQALATGGSPLAAADSAYLVLRADLEAGATFTLGGQVQTPLCPACGRYSGDAHRCVQAGPPAPGSDRPTPPATPPAALDAPASPAQQCPTCGQFMGAGHVCPGPRAAHPTAAPPPAPTGSADSPEPAPAPAAPDRPPRYPVSDDELITAARDLSAADLRRAAEMEVRFGKYKGQGKRLGDLLRPGEATQPGDDPSYVDWLARNSDSPIVRERARWLLGRDLLARQPAVSAPTSVAEPTAPASVAEPTALAPVAESAPPEPAAAPPVAAPPSPGGTLAPPPDPPAVAAAPLPPEVAAALGDMARAIGDLADLQRAQLARPAAPPPDAAFAARLTDLITPPAALAPAEAMPAEAPSPGGTLPARPARRAATDPDRTPVEHMLAAVQPPADPDPYLTALPPELGGKRITPLPLYYHGADPAFDVSADTEKAVRAIATSLQIAWAPGHKVEGTKFRAFGLYGTSGTGKNTTARQVAAALSLPYTERTLDRNTRVGDEIGAVVLDHGTSRVELGPLGLAAATGQVVCINELTKAPPSTLGAIQTMIEDGYIEIKGAEAGAYRIPVHPSTVFICTWNPGYEGVADRPEAAPLSRMMTIQMNAPTADEEARRLLGSLGSVYGQPLDATGKGAKDARRTEILGRTYQVQTPTFQGPQALARAKSATGFIRAVRELARKRAIGKSSPHVCEPTPREAERFLATVEATGDPHFALEQLKIYCDQGPGFKQQWDMIKQAFDPFYGADGQAVNRQGAGQGPPVA